MKEKFKKLKELFEMEFVKKWGKNWRSEVAYKMQRKLEGQNNMNFNNKCPECDAELVECVGTYYVDDETDGDTYDTVKCPNGCDIGGYYT